MLMRLSHLEGLTARFSLIYGQSLSASGEGADLSILTFRNHRRGWMCLEQAEPGTGVHDDPRNNPRCAAIGVSQGPSGGSRLQDNPLCRFPVEARIGDRQAVLELIEWLGKRLVAGLQIAFQHGSHNGRGALGSLCE